MKCRAPNCALPAAPDSDWCLLHQLVTRTAAAAQRAANRGDWSKGFTNGLYSIGAELAASLAGRLTQAPVSVGFTPPPQPPPRSPVDNGRDPFAYLGIPRTATEELVKSTQRRLAAIYHSDLNTKATPEERAAAEEKLKEVNQAAAACLESIRRRAASPPASQQ